MANLRANRITSTEVFETTGSVQFDGSGDFLSLADSEDFNFGSGDFTVEGWMYLIGSGEAYLLGQASSTGANSSGCVAVLTDSSNNLVARVFQSGGSYNELTHSVISKAVWNHFALVRSGSTLFLYLNGVSVQISIGSITLNNSTNQFGVGRLGEYTSKYFNGHISNLRILKGTALYTKNFTPPTRELEVIPNTVLLACQSTTKADEEKTGKTITVNGNAVANELTPGLLTNVVKSGGSSAITGSVEFNGNTSPGAGQYGITIASTAGGDFDFGSGSFTIEGWYYTNEPKRVIILGSSPNGSTSSEQIPFQIETTPTAAASGAVKVLLGDGTNFFTAQSVGVGTTTQCWNHFAAVKDGSDVKMYLNGVVGTGTTSVTGSLATAGVSTIFIGDGGFDTDKRFDGFLSNLRIIKGQALYKGNFIPPTRKLTKLPGTVLLCCTDSSNPLKEETGKTILLNGSVSTYSVGIGTTTPNPSKFTPYSSTDGTVVFDGVTKINTPNYFYLPTGPTEQRGRGRGVFGGGYIVSGPTSVNINTIEYVQIQSLSNAIDFGDLSVTRLYLGACSSSTRALFGGGYTQGTGSRNIIDYITIAATGNAIDFGDLQTAQHSRGSCSSSTRGIWASGTTNNQIDYVTIASTGNAQDFGDYGSGNRRDNSGVSSPTRGVFAGGFPALSDIEYITIASTGNSIDFGDLTNARFGPGGSSSAVRGIFAGGTAFPNLVGTNIIDYITIASTGNAIDFGDTTELNYRTAATSNGSRAVIAMSGGCSSPGPTTSNTYNYVTISTTGNAQDFGDASYICSGNRTDSGTSDSHGGLG